MADPCDTELAEARAAHDRYHALRFAAKAALMSGSAAISAALIAEAIIALKEFRAADQRLWDCWLATGHVRIVDILRQHDDLLAANIEYLESLV